MALGIMGCMGWKPMPQLHRDINEVPAVRGAHLKIVSWAFSPRVELSSCLIIFSFGKAFHKHAEPSIDIQAIIAPP